MKWERLPTKVGRFVLPGPERLREIVLFLGCGAANTIAGYVLYWLFLAVMSYQVAWAVSYVASIYLSYYLNARFVFRTPLSLSTALQFPLVYLLQYVASAVLLYVSVEILHIDQLLAPILAIVGTLPITYLSSRFVIHGSLSSLLRAAGRVLRQPRGS
jgi:putative flippase GtrA